MKAEFDETVKLTSLVNRAETVLYSLGRATKPVPLTVFVFITQNLQPFGQ
jgi:hypothetical protein